MKDFSVWIGRSVAGGTFPKGMEGNLNGKIISKMPKLVWYSWQQNYCSPTGEQLRIIENEPSICGHKCSGGDSEVINMRKKDRKKEYCGKKMSYIDIKVSKSWWRRLRNAIKKWKYNKAKGKRIVLDNDDS